MISKPKEISTLSLRFALDTDLSPRAHMRLRKVCSIVPFIPSSTFYRIPPMKELPPMSSEGRVAT
jgi:hypothetical protein